MFRVAETVIRLNPLSFPFPHYPLPLFARLLPMPSRWSSLPGALFRELRDENLSELKLLRGSAA